MTDRWRGETTSCVSTRMERYIGVSQARRYFADVLNTGAYASERLVILRRGEELGAQRRWTSAQARALAYQR